MFNLCVFSVTGKQQDAEIAFDNLTNIGQPQEYPEFNHTENNDFLSSKETNFNRQLPYVVTTFDDRNAVLSETVKAGVISALHTNEPCTIGDAPLSNTSASTRSSYQSVLSEFQGL